MTPLEGWLLLGLVLVVVFALLLALAFGYDLLHWFPDQAGKDVDELLRRDHALGVMKSWQGESPYPTRPSGQLPYCPNSLAEAEEEK